eukprot:TRINITY_DN2745_c0_g1_i6.p2 TRINITY_DN2745_c0_g1~~TRINITY_DN2745_c0_g1_i6.p2  ORF type:complete len:120 (-),score=29.34 TRINITY_DN2745_c0_g1_i6:691-1050(-)
MSPIPVRDTSIFPAAVDFESTKTSLEHSHLTCPICMDFMVGAVVTLCGHTFCERCILEWNLFNKDCPVCRQQIRSETPHPCPMMDALVTSFLEQGQMEQERGVYRRKMGELKEWKGSKV